jgi:CHAT domain-containing protein
LKKAKWNEVYQPKDQLQAYLEKLYDLTDEHPFYLSNKADSLTQTLWRQTKTKEEQTAYLDFVLNIAYHLLQQGQIQASTRWYEKGWNFQQQQNVVYEAEEFIIKPLGNNYVRLGDYDKAIALQQSAIEQATAQQKFNLLPSLYSNQAITYYWLGDYAATQTACNKGLQFINAQVSSTGLLYNVKADAFYAAKQNDSALFYNQKALEFFRSADAVDADASWMVSALLLSSKLLISKQQWQQALQKLQNAEKILEQTYPDSRHRDKAKLKVEKGNLFLQLQQNDSSKQNFLQGLQYFPIDGFGFFPDNTVTGLYGGLAKTLEAKLPDSSLYYHRMAVANDYYCSQLISSSVNSLQNSTNDEQVTEQALLFYKEQYQRKRKSLLLEELLWLVELSKGRKLLNEQSRSKQWRTDSSMQHQQHFFAELRNDYLLLAETNDAIKKTQISERIRLQELNLGLQENRFAQLLQQPSFAAFQQKLKEVTAKSQFISYVFLKDSLLLISCNESQQLLTVPAITIEQQADSLLKNYFTTGSSAFTNNPAAYFHSAYQIYQQLLPVAGNKPLIISADGVLHQLPFEALSNDGKDHFLSESTTVSYVYSFLQYVLEVKPQQSKLPVTVYTFSKDHLQFPALPNSKEEEKLLGRNYSISSKEATETTEQDFVQSLQSNSIIHIASHAVADSSGQPYLVLQQKFYLGQLQYISTTSPLVILTACETAAGTLQQNEGLASIGRSFISKGVKAVVASRWVVDDAVAPVLVQSFYRSLEQQHSPVAALYEARKQYLQQATSLAQKNPLLWSGFSYIGVDQQLQLQTSSFNWYWLLFLLLLPIGFYFFRMFKG